MTKASLKNITVNKYFMSVDGFDIENGFTTPNILETKISQLMMKAAREIIVVADSPKFGQRRIGIICGIADVDTIITSKNIDKLYLKEIKKHGVKLFML